MMTYCLYQLFLHDIVNFQHPPKSRASGGRGSHFNILVLFRWLTGHPINMAYGVKKNRSHKRLRIDNIHFSDWSESAVFTSSLARFSNQLGANLYAAQCFVYTRYVGRDSKRCIVLTGEGVLTWRTAPAAFLLQPKDQRWEAGARPAR